MNLGKPICVAPGIYQIRAVGSRVSVVVGDTGSVLVDSGGPGSFNLIASGLKALDLSFDQVDMAVLTHYHPDHTGGVGRLVREGRVKVAAHAYEAELIAGRELPTNPFRNGFVEAMTNPVVRRMYDPPPGLDKVLQDGDELPLGDGQRLVVVHTPGHTPGSVCLYAPWQRTLVVGDSLQFRFRRLGPPAAAVSQDMSQANESIRKLLSLDVDTICFSHFPPLRRGARAALQRLVDELFP